MKWRRRSTYENSLPSVPWYEKEGRGGKGGVERGVQATPPLTPKRPLFPTTTDRHLLLSNRWNSPRDPPPKEGEREREERVGRCGQEMRLFFHWERIATKWPPFSSSFHGRSIFPNTKKELHFLHFFGCSLQWYRFHVSCEVNVLKKRCVWKLAEKRDSFYKHIAGGPKPLFSGYPKMPGKVSKSRMQRLDHFILQQGALKSQGCGKSGVKVWLL